MVSEPLGEPIGKIRDNTVSVGMNNGGFSYLGSQAARGTIDETSLVAIKVDSVECQHFTVPGTWI